VLAFIENFQLSEGILIAIVAVLIFGKRLPQVAGQAAGHVGRARRALNELWRDAGLEEEMRKVQREVDHARSPFTAPRRAPGTVPVRARLPAPSSSTSAGAGEGRAVGADAARDPELVVRPPAPHPEPHPEPPPPRDPSLADDDPDAR
jgi:Sec-independent protein translocase protein TatA